MKKIAMAFIFASSSMSYGLTTEDEQVLQTMSEMKRLVSTESPARVELWCAVASLNLGMGDMAGLFLRKGQSHSTDAKANALAFSYMMGFFESELLNMKGRGQLNDEEALGSIKLMYSSACISQVIPK